MPKLNNRVPAYRHHKPSGQAVISLNGAGHCLGGNGSAEGRAKYGRSVAEWLAAGRSTAQPS